MRGDYSKSEDTTDAFIKLSHIMATIRSKLKEKLACVTSSAHKEQGFIQVILMSGTRHKKFNLPFEFLNSIFIKLYLKAYLS